MTAVLIDSNVLLRHLLADHPDHSPRATDAFQRVERGEMSGFLAATVIFETVFTLQRTYGRPKSLIAEALLAFLDLPGLIVPEERAIRSALTMYVELNIPFADAFHAATAREYDIQFVLSFDRHFDRVPDLERLEP